MTKLREVMQLLLDAAPLPEKMRDHPLKGEWKGRRDLHVEPDWVLIYRADPHSVHFERTGTHADLFKN